ncbi:MAG: TonB-dependent receptor [Campylobacterales bacterium]|nr:TonB-dependent receptor [Campylobacterales bacterium]
MKQLLALTLSTFLLAHEDTLNLLDDLNNASKISTKTKLNINKTPAVVSVLHSDALQKLGITSLYEALETVPGIEISMGIGGAKQINMRGNKSIVTDKLKFMVDGITINSELSGSNHFYLNMPIENIERIEIIRGPASALYGSYAHIGVINVITKAATHKKSTLFMRASNEGVTTAGFTQHLNTQESTFALSGSFVMNDKTREYANYTLLPNNAPFYSYEDFDVKSVGAIFSYKDFSITSKFLEEKTQNYFGYGAWPIINEPYSMTHTSFVNEAEYTPQVSQELDLDLKLGYKEYSMKGKSRVVPYSVLIPSSEDFISEGTYKEKTLYSDLSLNYHYANNKLTFGTYLSRIKVDNPLYKQNTLLPVLAPIPQEEPTIYIPGGGLIEHITREQFALYLNDIITLSSEWIANLGVRYDNYSDADSALSPKLSVLYMPDEKQSYKLMYQNSFRVPTFVESYGSIVPFIGDQNLQSETIDTLEFAYTYEQDFQRWLNVNFFYTKTENFVYRDTNFQLKNGPRSHAYGAELEFKFPLYQHTILQANYSYVYSVNEHGNETPLIANNLANAMLFYQISKDWHTGSKIRYVGERTRELGDVRDPLKAYITFDQTLSYSYKELLIQASIKNIFNEDIRFIAAGGNDVSSGSYLDDLEQTGRSFWLTLEWKFICE